MIGATLSGRYRIDSKLGSGGMSTVYLARDETLERWVAIKVLHREISDQEDQLQRFRHEARAVAQLSHPNLVAVIDAGEDAGHPYIVFEYVEGETLKGRIDRLGKLPLDEAAAYAIEIGRGLACAHARSIVHRDVKPQNVLIDPEGRAKVTDFGIARSLDTKGLTATGRVLGTTDYVSPEQAMGHVVDARSDIYSLGVVLFEMLVGHPPFAAETLVGVAMKHVNEPMPDVQIRRAETSAALAAVIERATVKDPDGRYGDMAEMLDDLERALEVEIARAGTSTGEATAVLRSVPDRERKLLTGRNVSVAGILVVLLAGAAALLIAALEGEEGPSRDRGDQTGAAQVELTGAEAFDPEGGDGENEEDVGLAIDGDLTTAWPTETYQDTPVLSELGKSGVGVIVDAGEVVDASELRVRSLVPGWSGEIYATQDDPPSEITAWGEPVASISDAGEEESVSLADAEARYYLLWFTELGEVGDSVGSYRAETADIRLFARS